jgi:dCMP deaminase
MKKDWDLTFLQIAKLMSEHSTCSRVQVGAVLTKDRRIISCGYNGVPSGQKECKDYFRAVFDHRYLNKLAANMRDESFDAWRTTPAFSDLHREFSINNELHAEQNAIGYAARNGIATEGSTIYLTISPCKQCAKLLIAAGVEKVVYAERYNRSEDDGLGLLIENNVACVKVYGNVS